MATIIIEGKPFEGLPLPVEPLSLVGRKFVELKKRQYVIDVYEYPSDSELVWKAYKWNGLSWPKIPMFTRAEENRFPKTIAKMAFEFLHSIRS